MNRLNAIHTLLRQIRYVRQQIAECRQELCKLEAKNV